MTAPKLLVSRRIRATPYTSRVEALGVSGYSVVNHTVLPKGFQKSVVDDYWHLKTHVQLWDVGCQRQVELLGPDAARLVQLMTPRDLRNARAGQCLYAPLIDENASMLNDPIILKLAEDRYWLSIADADILLWAKGLALGMGLEVAIDEPDVWPLSIQGPKSDDLAARIFGEHVREIGFFKFRECEFAGQPVIVARTGYSKQGGFEMYPEGFSFGTSLWDAIWQAGPDLQLSPGCPNLIERVEGGLLSYGNEMTRTENPLECGLEKYCQLDGSVDYIGREALQRLAETGPRRLIRGLIFDGEACPPCQHPWPISVDKRQVGYVTSAIWSPRFGRNVALAMLDRGFWEPGTAVAIDWGDGTDRSGIVTNLPMEDA
ncbi:MAG: dimethylsulfoniopropionate demethylase [Gammaproteobacteria bacterium]|nr:dimethylsulfoniopropionate demethylase [Gammaproteobacteria bacterium]MDH3535080.1 dimethylsulfoniopropionate demethylase [Gammaproteobacteria bacterium]